MKNLNEAVAYVEYPSVLRHAMAEGWCSALLEAHTIHCTQREAIRILALLQVPGRLVFRKRGRAAFHRRTKTYSVTLPSLPGGNYRGLRVGLVLHEAAHILEHLQHNKFSGHGPRYCRSLRAVLNTDWKELLMPAGTLRDIYGRHPGRYSLLLTRSVVSKKSSEQCSRLEGPFSAEEAHEEARMLVNDPRENVTEVYVFNDTEGQFIGAFYKRGVDYAPWEEMDGRVELPDECPEAALLPGREEPLQPMDAVVHGSVQTEPVSEPRPVRNVSPKKRSLLVIGRSEGWPGSPAAQAVKTFVEGHQPCSASDISEGTQLTVAHPASLVSRLKQAGFLKEQS